MARTRRRGRFRRTFERVALGAVMGAVAFVLERRLLKAVRGRGGTSPKRERSGADLTVTSKEVDDQAGG